jgi:hypothetical protein
MLDGMHHSTCSMGAGVFDGQANSVEELLKRADLAMYQAKAAGRNTLRFFDPEMQQAVTARAPSWKPRCDAGCSRSLCSTNRRWMLTDHQREALLRWRWQPWPGRAGQLYPAGRRMA